MEINRETMLGAGLVLTGLLMSTMGCYYLGSTWLAISSGTAVFLGGTVLAVNKYAPGFLTKTAKKNKSQKEWDIKKAEESDFIKRFFK